MLSVQRWVFAAALGLELHLWARDGHRPRFWWRDDDARRPSAALTRLLDLSKRYGAPLTLATVPDEDLAAIAALVGQHETLEIAIHGFCHENRAKPGGPSGEIIDTDRLEDVSARLDLIKRKLKLVGLAATAFVPPWNNLHPTLEKALELHDLELSCHGQMRQMGQRPVRIDTHLDLMRWKPTARFRGTLRLALRARRLLATRRRLGAWDEPLGILTHHLDHDEATWQFLEFFLSRTVITRRRDCLI